MGPEHLGENSGAASANLQRLNHGGHATDDAGDDAHGAGTAACSPSTHAPNMLGVARRFLRPMKRNQMQEQMSKMSPEQMAQMAKMAQNMNPEMMRNMAGNISPDQVRLAARYDRVIGRCGSGSWHM